MCWALCSCCFCLVTLLIKYLGDWFCDDSDPFSGVLRPVSVDSFCCLQLLRWLAVYMVIISDLNAIGMRSFTSSSVCFIMLHYFPLSSCLFLAVGSFRPCWVEALSDKSSPSFAVTSNYLGSSLCKFHSFKVVYEDADLPLYQLQH